MASKSSQHSVELQGLSSCYETALTDQYEVLRDIGQGAFSQVKLARHLLTGAEVAVKILTKVNQKAILLCEPDNMKGLDHQNVIQLFQVIETTENIYMVMERVDGAELRRHIPRYSGMQEEEACRLFRQMARALRYCHEKGIAHLDLKPENVLVDAGGNVKLIDFGLSARYTAGQKVRKLRGTLYYIAPEIIQCPEYEGPPADVWSLGVVLYFMLTGILPFMAITATEMKVLIVQGRFHIPPHVSKGPRHLIRKMLVVDPMQRPTVQQILAHPWPSQGAGSSPTHSSEALPKLPDPTIATIMFDMGYDPYNTWLSLEKRKYDEAMGTYLILQHQIKQGMGCKFQRKPGHRRLGTPPTPDDSSNVRPKRSVSAPVLSTFRSPCEQKLPEAREFLRKWGASASVPAIHLRFLHVRTPSSRFQQVRSPTPGFLQVGTATPSFSSFLQVRTPTPTIDSQHEPESPRPKPSLITADGGTSFQSTSTGQSDGNSRGWKGVKRRIATCIQQLCCCVPCFPGQAFRNRVAPMGGGQRPVRFQNRVAPA